jgi:tRNA A58 N-methylase Trm61
MDNFNKNGDLPWLPMTVVHYLDMYLEKDMTVFEYGSGNSTQFFSERVGKVYSVENDKEWYEVSKNKNLKNVELFLIESEGNALGDPSVYKNSYSSKQGEFKNYVLKINDFEDETFDVVLVDGRARPSCAYNAMSKVKKGGIIVLDDSERERYKKFIRTLTYKNKDFDEIKFQRGRTRSTIIWMKK